jgi:hypothetical protein
MVACGGGKKAEEAAAQAKADSIRIADSIAAAAPVVVDSAAVAVDSAAVK